jgi:hypothetical protein
MNEELRRTRNKAALTILKFYPNFVRGELTHPRNIPVDIAVLW